MATFVRPAFVATSRSQNEVLSAKAVDLRLLRLPRRLFNLMFYAHVRTSNSDNALGLYT